MRIRGIPVLLLILLLGAGGVQPLAAEKLPSILLVTVDTLRADRLSGYGYTRNTSPHIDALLRQGVRFTQARTVEPLTAPALASMLTSLPPQEHGSTRNGMRVRPDLLSVSKILRHHGYKSAAFVGNWTLRDELWGMAGQFDEYEEVMTKARWFGLVKREAMGEDLTDRASEWLSLQLEDQPGRPFFLWVHYVEPHAPYKLQRAFLDQLGAAPDGDLYSASGKYDSEIAYVDHHISRLLEHAADLVPAAEMITLFAADHGESLGEHGYWGHGRHVYDATLHIPMGITWPGRLEPREIGAPALITDLAPTLLTLVGLPVPDFFQGMDWTPVLWDEEPAPAGRVTYYQAHKGVTSPKEDPNKTRQRGLLEVARVERGMKEILRVPKNLRRLFDLSADPSEQKDLAAPQSEISDDLRTWLETVQAGLAVADQLPPPSLSKEDLAALRALGYLD
jgi:arylsulfatase A-like enzyme